VRIHRWIRGSARRSRRRQEPFSSLICAFQGHGFSLVRLDSVILIGAACAIIRAIFRDGDFRHGLLVVFWCLCHEPKGQIEPRRPTKASRTRRSADGDLEIADSLLYGILTSTSAILKIESNGCVCTSWCLLLILSLRSCIIDAHSFCKSNTLVNKNINKSSLKCKSE